MSNIKNKIEYVIEGAVNGGFFKALNSTNRALAKTSKAAAMASKFQAKAGSSGIFLGGGLVKTAIGAAAAYVGLSQLTGAYHDIMEETNGAVYAQTRLNTLMGNIPGMTKKQIASVSELSEKLMKLTTIDDDVTKTGASQLATYQMQTKSILKLLPALQDLAVGTYGMNVNEEQITGSANLLGKVFAGQVGALRKVGVSFTKAQEKVLKMGKETEKVAMLVKVVQQNYGGMARAAAQTPEGKQKQLLNLWNDIKKVIGFELIPIQQAAISFMVDKLPLVSSLVEKLIAGAHRLAPVFQPVVKVLAQIGQKLGAQDWGKIGAGLLKIVQPIYSFIAGKLLPFIGKLIADIGGIFARAWPQIQPALQQLGKAIGNVLNAVMPILNAIWSVAKPILAFVIGKVLPILIKAIAWVVNLVATLVKKLTQAFTWLVKIGGKVGKWVWNNSPAGMATNAVMKATGKNKALAQKGAGGPVQTPAHRAAGGPVQARRPYIVGERGPELLIPRIGGTIMPNAALAGAGGITFSGPINFHFGGNVGGDPQRAGKAAADAFMDRLRRMQRDEERRSFDD